MTPDIHKRAKEIFLRACDLAPDERIASAEAACAGDPELCEAVFRLLANDNDPRRLEDGADMRMRLSSMIEDGIAAPPPAHPELIGPYRVKGVLGEGGFGTVYEVEQSHPVRRTAAIKVIKSGMDTRQVIARFAAERQALALMDHPGIARVFDVGETETGRPYFVMELVRGSPITRYCDDRSLTTAERLELFIQVVGAVQHAHLKGIIHRDIKPSNVLVTEPDSSDLATPACPKLIDFGIARAMESGTGQLSTSYTEQGQMVGTPEYMSPEQASGREIDTRTDIYSLGVLLYELLTGTTPLDRSSLKGAGEAGIVGAARLQRLICETDPPTPSVRLGTLGAQVAQQRRTDMTTLRRVLRADLDWIIMKCLEKDPVRRYQSAIALAVDLRRFIAGEPVDAAPPSTSYRLRKFVHRHRAPVLAGSAVALTLVLGIIGTSAGLLWAVRGWREEGRQRQKAAAERDKAEAFGTFMEDMLARAAPGAASGRDTTLVREMLDDTAREISAGRLESMPAAELRLRRVIADTYRQIGAFSAAQDMLDPAEQLAAARTEQEGGSARGDSELARVLAARAELLHDMGKDDEADSLADRALEIDEQLSGPQSESVMWRLSLVARQRLARGKLGAADGLFQRALEIAKQIHRHDHRDTAALLYDLATVRQTSGRLAEAEPLYQQALEMRQRLYRGDHLAIAASLDGLGGVRQATGRADEAEPLYRQALEMRRRLYHGDHAEVASSLNNIAGVLHAMGRLDEARTHFEEALAMDRRLFGSVAPTGKTSAVKGDHPDIAGRLHNLALVHQQLGDRSEAKKLFREALEMDRRLYASAGHPHLALVLHHLAVLLRETGKPVEAEPLAVEAFAMYRDHPDWNPQEAGHAGSVLSTVLADLGRGSQSVSVERGVVEIMRHHLPGSRPVLAAWLAVLGRSLMKQSDLVGAAASLRESLDIRREIYPEGHPQAGLKFTTMTLLGESLMRRAEDAAVSSSERVRLLTEAEELLKAAYDFFTAGDPALVDRARSVTELLVQLHTAWEAAEPNQGHLAQVEQWKARRTQPGDRAAPTP